MQLRFFRLSHWMISLLLVMASTPLMDAQCTLTHAIPQAIVPGKTTRIELLGQNLNDPLRIAASIPIETHIVSIEPTKATLDVTIPQSAPLGPWGVWVATDNSISEPLQLLVDDLPSVVDNGANHQRDQAQRVELPCAIDGKSELSQSDFYVVHATAGTLSIDVVAERIGSTMDALIRVYDTSGKLVVQSDDSDVGPDSRIQFAIPSPGDYWIEIGDSRYAGESRYRLRLGNFSLGHIPYPLAVSPGVPTPVLFLQSDGSVTAPCVADVPSGTIADRVNVGLSDPSRVGGPWGQVLVRNMPIYCEPWNASESTTPSTESLTLPLGICGRLHSPNERDSYWIHGTAGQTVRIASRTRSLGIPTLLRMRLMNPAGQRIAETVVNDSDEWSMDVPFAETGLYRLEVDDILGRAGPTYAYWVEVVPTGRFTVSIKPDVNTKENRLLETGVGALAVDLQVQRFGYDGPIQLELIAPKTGLRIVNPNIPATTLEARIYLSVDSAWTTTSLSGLEWIAKRVDAPDVSVPVSSIGLRRIKAAHQPFPPNWLDGRWTIAGIAPRDPFLALELAHPISLPRPLKQHGLHVNLKRLHPEFKEGVAILGTSAPDGWNAQTVLDKDTLNITLQRSEGASPSSETTNATSSLTLLAFGHFQTGRIEPLVIPIAWYDPLKIEVDTPADSIIAGSQGQLTVRIIRSGPESQAVQLACNSLPHGITCDGPIVIPPDQSTVVVPLQVAADFVPTEPISIQMVGTSKLGEAEYQVLSNAISWNIEPSPARIDVFPARIRLTRSRDTQRVAVTGWSLDNAPRDWTTRATWTISDPSVARMDNGEVVPVGNGQTELRVQVGGFMGAIPVSVEQFERPAPIEFENEVLVALSKQGCNSGACHGAPSGKGNFRLSLRAFDKSLDSLTLVREDSARRINAIDPEQSLLLRKPLMKLPHGGGMQLHRSDRAYTLLRDWIGQGATLDRADQARCVRLEVFPNDQRILSVKRGDQQVLVTAHFSDGSSRDVTSLAVYDSSHASVATISTLGRVHPVARGETVIMVRYLEHIESIPFLFVEDIPGFEWNALPQINFIDTLVDAKLRQLQYTPAPLCSEEVFLRRLYLDVIGILPTVEETTAYLADPSPDKRNRLIDRLLERPEYSKFWALKWGDLLRMTLKSVGNDGVHKYHRWVEQSIRDNVPYHEFAKQLLTASGSTFVNPPANFYRTAANTNDCVETISQVFLGARLQCAKCHNHPFERWTQDNYYGLGAFFQRVERKKTQRPHELVVWSNTAGEVVQPRTGKTMKPWAPIAGEMNLDESIDRRNAFADWLIRTDNPYLARVEANRIWSQFFARGIVDPIDDFRDSNPPTNRPLLDALTESFVASGFDRKQLIRTILQSRTYQASFETTPFNEKDYLYFSHQQPRLLSAEQLLDAINQLTQTEQSFGNLPMGTKATQIPAPDLAKVDFLKVFGQPERSTVCACERSEDSNLSMAIELFNGTSIYDKLRNPNNRFRQGLAAGKSVEGIIQEMYVAGLARMPTADELKGALQHCSANPDPIAGLEDLCWVLINTDEFLFQH